MNSFNNIVFNKNSSGNTIKIYFSTTFMGLRSVVYNGDFYFENYYLPNGPDANSLEILLF